MTRLRGRKREEIDCSSIFEADSIAIPGFSECHCQRASMLVLTISLEAGTNSYADLGRLGRSSMDCLIISRPRLSSSSVTTRGGAMRMTPVRLDLSCMTVNEANLMEELQSGCLLKVPSFSCARTILYPYVHWSWFGQ